MTSLRQHSSTALVPQLAPVPFHFARNAHGVATASCCGFNGSIEQRRRCFPAAARNKGPVLLDALRFRDGNLAALFTRLGCERWLVVYKMGRAAMVPWLQ